MKIHLWSIGKPHEVYVKTGVEDFTKRISTYYPVAWKIIASTKNAGVLSDDTLKKKEAAIILPLLAKEDYLVALDERGKAFTSEKLAQFIQLRANESTRNLVFLIGGAYGLHETITNRANLQWSLSPLVFPHQLVRLILAEQIYRACTILRNEKYHHS
jgi:23S rRNA (pseudouridine1915-N3)-methyltransferase